MNTPLLERDLAADKFGHYLKDNNRQIITKGEFDE